MSRLPSKAKLDKLLILQEDRINCVPIGIYTLLKLSGATIWKKDIRRLKIILNVNRKTGGCQFHFLSDLATWVWGKKLASVKTGITIRKIDRLLETTPILLGFIHEDWGVPQGHVATILKKTEGGRYLVNNWFTGKKTSLITEEYLTDVLTLSKKFQRNNLGLIVYPHIDYIEGNVSWL